MFKKIIKYLSKDYPLQLFFLIILMFLASIFESIGVSAIAPLIEGSGQVSASASTGITQSFSSLFHWMGIDFTIPNLLLFITFLLLLKSLLNVLKSVVMKSIQTKYEITSKAKLLEQILYAKMTYLYRQNFGKILNIATQETRFMSSLVLDISSFTNSIMSMFIYLGLVLIVSWQLTIFTLVVGIAVYLLLYRLYGKARSLGHDIANFRSLIQEALHKSLFGNRMIKSYVIEPQITGEFTGWLEKMRKCEIKSTLLESIQISFFEPLVMFLCLIAVVFWNLPLASFFVFLVALGKMYTSIKTIQNTHYKMAVHVASLDVYEEVTRGLSKRQVEKKRNLQVFENLKNTISFEDLLFSYDCSSSTFCLGPLNLTIKSGQTIGLVGGSGSGKSTCTDLIMGLLSPQSGSIVIDGIDIRELNIQSLRRKIGYVDQEAYFFNDSILNNITLREERFTFEDVQNACKLACIDEFIEGLPEKYRSLLGEQGASFSGGQKQRIALARALIRKPEILILDEATSALDSKLENNIREVLRLMHGVMTIIIVAHRLSTIKDADVIYVLDQGKLVESGTFEQVVRMNSHLANLNL